MSKGRNKKKKKRTRVFVWLLLIGLAACVVLSLTVFFPIVSIDVTGNVTAYPAQAIIEASGIKIEGNLFAFSAPHAESRICAELPYIEKADVHRKLSGAIVIECTESTAFLAIPCEGTCLVVNPELKIVAKEESNSLGRAAVYGISPLNPKTGETLAASGEDGTEYLAYVVDAIMAEELLGSVTSLNVADKLNLSLVYENRLFVMIGTASNIEYKFRMLARVTREELAPSDTGYLDLSEAGRATFKAGDLAVPEGYDIPAQIKTE